MRPRPSSERGPANAMSGGRASASGRSGRRATLRVSSRACRGRRAAWRSRGGESRSIGSLAHKPQNPDCGPVFVCTRLRQSLHETGPGEGPRGWSGLPRGATGMRGGLREDRNEKTHFSDTGRCRAATPLSLHRRSRRPRRRSSGASPRAFPRATRSTARAHFSASASAS